MASVTKKGPEIYYLGNNVSPIYIEKLLEIVKGKSIYINVISKSGTTLEPALSFRIMKKIMEETYGKEEALKRIIVTTDKEKGVLKKLSLAEGYRTFEVPGNIGGRYSVITAVGLLPIAVSGVDIKEIIQGAVDGSLAYQRTDLSLNDCYQYAAVRNLLYRDDKNIELLVNYEPSLNSFAEWWKQLFGESEGKDHKGIFPASVSFTTDLHSIGQYIQDGRRNLFTTTLWVENTGTSLQVPHVPEDVDGLSYLEGMPFEEINKRACQGTMKAHVSGGVPNLKITIPALTPYYYGQLVYFFLKSCAISGYLLGVNPFDQPGVEEYKKNMYSLLKK
jgi:glucose-6-phosphate isomerase